MDDIFDFGFTAVTEEELEAVQEAQMVANETSSTVSELERKLEKLYNAIQPLLNNLKIDNEKSYIYWPNRLEKIEAFEKYIANIYSE